VEFPETVLYQETEPAGRESPRPPEQNAVRIAATTFDEALAYLRWTEPEFKIDSVQNQASRLNHALEGARTNKIKRPDYDSDFDSPEEIEDVNQWERMERRAKNAPPPKLGLNFTEAVGKVVAFVNVINDPPEWQALKIRFTDGTLLHFEFLTTQVQIKPKYMEARRGDLELICNYGVLPIDDQQQEE
jgi:hypothetical protein